MKRAIVLDQFGSFLARDHDNLVVRLRGEVIETMSVSQIDRVVLAGHGVSISNAVILLCAKSNIPIFCLDSIKRPIAVLMSPGLLKRNHLTSAQRRFSSLPEATRFVCGFIEDKIRGQHSVIEYHARSLRLSPIVRKHFEYKISPHLSTLKSVFESDRSLDDCREEIFLVEARAANEYWKGIESLLDFRFRFAGRVHRHAKDPFNQLANYGYAILSSAVHREILFSNLNPSIGLLHHRRVASYPLVYDLMEPFRPIVDHIVLTFLHRQHSDPQDAAGSLRPTVLRRFRKFYFDHEHRPQPWSKDDRTLQQMIHGRIADFEQTLEKAIDKVGEN